MKIGFFELEGWEEPIIREIFSGHELTLTKEKITEFSLPEKRDFDVLSIFVESRIDQAILASFPNVTLITTRSTGYDHVDVAACKARGVSVAYVPGYGENTVAEFAFGLILSLTRKIYQGVDQIKETGSFSLVGLRGMDLKGKTIGVIGTGRIGKEMVKIAKGFGMDVVAYDMFPDQNFANAQGFAYMPLEKLLGSSDVISVNCPLTDKTFHLINKNNIQFIKKGAYLVNTARGPIVEAEALLAALEQGILAGAGLDVLEEEGETKDELTTLTKGHPKEEELKTMIRNHMLMKMPNVIITPHNAFNSHEALKRILDTTISNIKGFLEQRPVNLVP